MENKKQNKGIHKEFMNKIKDFSNSPQEEQLNPMGVHSDKIIKAVQPHNYRLYFDFQRVGYNPTQPYLPRNYGSEDHFLFPTHRAIVRKKSIEIQYLAHQKQWRRVIADSEEQISNRIDELDQEFEDKCITYLKEFIEKNGGKSEFNLLRKRKQDWGIHGDEFLDKIQDEMIITDTIFKKVYRDKVEFTNPNNVKNYLSNRALERFSPQIAEELSIVRKMVNEAIKLNVSTCKTIAYSANHQAFMAENLKEHIPAMKRLSKSSVGIQKGVKQLVGILSQKKLKEYF